MSSESTYRAILYGPNVIAAGQEMDLQYVDGKQQEFVQFSTTEGDDTITRVFRKAKDSDNEEPVPYRFVEEDNSDDETSVPN
ncbi:hypothetical protein [Leifsonia sp. A12D58]|uniref:hypothetical protein n=1 Tax=Leifsonia sp. A12D58 TaxID=3397674 RepID=UPI0039DF9046